MCEPISATTAMVLAGGLGSQALSTQLQNRAAGKVSRARNAVLEQDRLTQQRHQMQATAINDEQQGKFTAENQRALQAANIEKTLNNNTQSDSAVSYDTATRNAPVEVKSEIARQIASALNSGRNYGKTQAKLSSYGQTQFDNNLGLTRTAEDLERINNFSRGDSNLVQSRLANANTKGQGSRNAADIFGGIGDIAMLYGMSTAGRPAKATPKPAFDPRMFSI